MRARHTLDIDHNIFTKWVDGEMSFIICRRSFEYKHGDMLVVKSGETNQEYECGFITDIHDSCNGVMDGFCILSFGHSFAKL